MLARKSAILSVLDVGASKIVCLIARLTPMEPSEALRGRTHGDGGTFWTWRKAMYQRAGRLSPDAYLRLARAVYAERR